MMQKKSISIVMPVHNHGYLMKEVIRGILNNSSENVKEILIILDACTDNSEQIISETLFEHSRKIKTKLILNSTDLWETKCCNIGFKNSECDYSLNIQDDMIVTENNFDQKLLKPFINVSNVFAVTARNAADVIFKDGIPTWTNLAGRDINSPRNIFFVRDIFVRGPVLFDNQKLKELNYLDEDFAPFTWDDYDISLRAYRKGYLVGFYNVDYISRVEWGGSRKPSVISIIEFADKKNRKLIAERHFDLINAKKHAEDIQIN